MKKVLIIIILAYSAITSAQTKKIKFVRGKYPSEHKFRWIKHDSSKVACEILNFRGGCCDCPSPELMNSEVVNDTLYFDTAIEKHTIHDKIGICGVTIMLVIDTIDYPNYRRLIIKNKELKSTKNRKFSHIND